MCFMRNTPKTPLQSPVCLGELGGCMHRVGCVVSICRPTLFFLGAPKTDRREPSWPNTRDKVASQGSSESEGS